MNLQETKQAKQTEEMMMANNEKTMAFIIDKFKARFPEDKIVYSGRIISFAIRIDLLFDGPQERFAEISKYCADYEELIAYPEIRITTRAIDSSSK